MERQRGQDGGLGSGVESLDVCGRVGLGVAQGLGLLDRVSEARAGGVHLVQHVVGGAVDDAQDAPDVIPDERLAQGAQQGDGPGDRRLVVQVDIALLGRLVETRAVLGQQCLVGRDDAGAVLHRCQDQAAGRLDATDDLDDHVGPGDELLSVGGEQRGIDTGL